MKERAVVRVLHVIKTCKLNLNIHIHDMYMYMHARKKERTSVGVFFLHVN